MIKSDLVVFIESLFAHKIISAQALEIMLKSRDSYGLGIRHLPFFGNDSYGHSGGIDGFTSALYYFPGQKLTVAITSNGCVYTTKAVLKAVASFYFGKDFNIPTFKTIELKPEELDQYVGNYIDPTLPLEINITKDNTKLIAQSPGQSSIVLEATEKDIFEFQAAGIKLEFKPAENKVILYQGGQVYPLTRK